MNLLQPFAVASRSLRVDARSGLVHGLRVALGVLLLLSLLGVYLTRSGFGAPGLNLYNTVITLDLFFVGVIGVALFATTITEEREEGSLGLMQMAGFQPLGILVGKSLAQLTIAVSLLAIQVPFMMFAVTLGGVTVHQILGGFVIVGSYLLLAYGAGLFSSTVCRTGTAASRMTFGILILANVWPAIVDVALEALSILGAVSPESARDVVLGLAEHSAWGALTATVETNYGNPLLGSASLIHACGGIAFFLCAWVLFDSIELRAGREVKKRTLLGYDSWGGQQRVPRFSGNAMAWKDYRLFVGGRRGILIRVVLYGVGMLVLGLYYNPFSDELTRHTFGRYALYGIGIGVLLDMGSLAGRVFRDEILWQTYSTLLLLPKSVLQISYGKMVGCMVAIVPALCYLIPAILCCESAMILYIGPVLLGFGAALCLILPLITYSSLWLNRGAFPLLVFACATLGAGAYLVVTMVFDSSGWIVLVVLFVAVCPYSLPRMNRKILQRLSDLSGCDV